MIVVDENYQKAVSSDVRETNAFVELLVDSRYIRSLEEYGGISSNDKAEITVLDTVVDDVPVFVNYASFEQDYFMLDGSFILPNRNNNINTGFVGDINSSTLTISNIEYYTPEIERNKKCVTVIFENGYATDFTITLQVNNGTSNLIPLVYTYNNNDKNTITTPTIEINNFKNIQNIEININNWNNPNHRVRIKQIYLGETVIYESNEIIEINVNEQTDIYNIEMPNNDCSIKLNNYDRKFNIVDKNNILNRLNNNSVIRIYYGIKVNGNYNYICMGNYEYNSYSDENNLYTVINGVGIMENYTINNSFLPTSISTYASIKKTSWVFNQIIGNELYNKIKYNANVDLRYTNFNNQKEQLQALAILSESYIKQSRNLNYYNNKNELVVSYITNNINHTIPLNLQLNYPKIEKTNNISQFIVSNKYLGVLNENEDIIFEDIVQAEYDMENNQYRIYLRITSDSPININTLKVYSNNVIINNWGISDTSYYQAELFIYNLINQAYNLKITAQKYNDENQVDNISYNKGEILEYNNNYLRDINTKKRVCNYFINNEKNYTYEFEMMYNPSIEIGDMILFESLDGYKKGIITSIESKYNGGITAIIKGECENVLQ